MTEKISRDEQKRNKALDKAWDQIRYLDQRRKQFAMTLGTTGDSGRAQIESITTEMEDIASRSGFTLEQVLAGREAPTKDERAAAQVKLELSLLEKNYKDMSKAVAASPDPYARMHLEGTRQGIERSIFEFAEKNGLDKVEILARLREMTPEDLKKIGAEKIRQLAIERKQHELKVTMGDPDSREKYFEFEHRARKIVEEHGLPVSELTPFLAPEIPPDVEKELAEVSSSEAAAIKEEVRVAETTPADKRGFLKKLFGVGSKEARQQKKEEAEHAQIFEALGGYQAKYKEVTGYLKNESDQNSPLALELKSVLRNIEKGAYEAALRLPPGDRTLQNLGPFRSLLDANDKPRPSSFIDGKDEKFTPIPKESRYERFKHSLRKYFTIGIFAASTLNSVKTTDTTLAPSGEGKKIEMATDIPDASLKGLEKADENAFMAAHTKLEAERVAHAAQAKIQPSVAHTGTSISTVYGQKRADDAIAPLDLASLRQVSDSTERAAEDTVAIGSGIAAPVSADTSMARAVDTAGTAAAEAPVTAKTARAADTIAKIETSAPRAIKTAIPKNGAMLQRLRELDVVEKQREATPKQAAISSEKASEKTAEKKVAAPGYQDETVIGTAPRPVDGYKPRLNTAPEAVGLWSPGAHEETPPPAAPSKGKVRVAYQDQNGNPIDISTFAKPAAESASAPSTASKPSLSSNEKVVSTSTAGSESETTKITAPGSIAASGVIRTVPGSRIITTAPSQPAEDSFFMNKAPYVRDAFPEAASGYTLEPVDTQLQTRKAWLTHWEKHDDQVRMEDGFKVHRSLWERVDPTVWHALQGTPGALKLYLEKSEKEQAHAPYAIQVWNGNKGMEYVIKSNNLLAMAPKERSRGTETAFGHFNVSIEDVPGVSNKRLVTGAGAQNYATLDELDRRILQLIAMESGTKHLDVYSIEAGAPQEFDHDALVPKGADQVRKEIQEEIDRLRKEKLVKMHVTEQKVFVDGKTVIKKVWVGEYPARPTPKIKEAKLETSKNKNFLRKKNTTKNRTAVTSATGAKHKNTHRTDTLYEY